MSLQTPPLSLILVVVRVREQRAEFPYTRLCESPWCRAVIPAETLEHTGELRKSAYEARKARDPHEQWRLDGRGPAAKGPFTGPQFRNSDPETR